MFLSLDPHSEYWTQRIQLGYLYKGVSGFATDCPHGIWNRCLTTCLLYVGVRFGNRLLNSMWAVCLT